MPPATSRDVRGTLTGFRAHHVSPVLLALTVGAVLAVAGCTSHAPAISGPPAAGAATTAVAVDPNAAASAVISSLGAVPIPSAPETDPTPTATPAHPQLLAIGAPVIAHLPDGSALLITALGPDQLSTAPASGGKPPQSTIGLITINARVTHGSVTLSAAEFTSRDQTGKLITLTPRGPATVSATNGRTATLSIQGRFTSGAAQITWTHQKSVLALWDFNIELD